MPSAASRNASAGDIGFEKSTPASSSRTCGGVISSTTGLLGIVEMKFSIRPSSCDQSSRRSAASSSNGSRADNEREFFALIETPKLRCGVRDGASRSFVALASRRLLRPRCCHWLTTLSDYKIQIRRHTRNRAPSIVPALASFLLVGAGGTPALQLRLQIYFCAPSMIAALAGFIARKMPAGTPALLTRALCAPPAFSLRARSTLACAKGPSDSRPGCRLRGQRDGMGLRSRLDSWRRRGLLRVWRSAGRSRGLLAYTCAWCRKESCAALPRHGAETPSLARQSANPNAGRGRSNAPQFSRPNLRATRDRG